MNYLMLSVGRRAELMKNFRQSMLPGSRIISTDNSPFAPALFFSDKKYLVPLITDDTYIDTIIDICEKERIDVVTTFIDPEIMLLSRNREKFSELGVTVLAPFEKSAEICFDKYLFYKYIKEKGIPTPNTWGSLSEFGTAFQKGEVTFPVFVKPRFGSGSVGAHVVYDYQALKIDFENDPSLIAQELMTGEGCLDLDADVYIDTISHKPVAIFSKRKISSTIGGANKTISFKDDSLFVLIKKIVELFEFNGPIDMDFFYKDGTYYLSEINPRFGGAYLHAYGAGVDFIKLIDNNLLGNENPIQIGNYEEGIVMMMYDSVVIEKVIER